MSASRERKKREDQSTVAQPEVKKSKKISEGWIFAISMILILVVVIGGLLIYRYCQAHKTVLTVGDHEVDVCEFNYFYREIASSCAQYSSYIGLDTTVALDEQKVSASSPSMVQMYFGLDTSYFDNLTTDANGYYNVTWAQFLADAAHRNAASAYSVYQAAMKAGYKLTAEQKKDIDASVKDFKDACKSFNETNGVSYDLDEYIEMVFGRDCDEEGYREYLKVVAVASAYPSELEYSDAEKAARDEKNPEDFDNVTFYYYVTDGTTVKADLDAAAAEAEAEEETADDTAEEVTDEATDEATDATEAETESTEAESEAETEPTEAESEAETESTEAAPEEEAELTEEEKAEYNRLAQIEANKMAVNFDLENEDVSIQADLTREGLENVSSAIAVNDTMTEWLFNTAEPGDVKMFTIFSEEEGGETRYAVVKFISKEDYNTINHLYIVIEDDATAEDGTETEHVHADDEEYSAMTAEEKVAAIKASLEADNSEENFRSWILKNLDHDHAEGEEHDHSEEGVIENATRGSFTGSIELYNWAMVEERTAGDWFIYEKDGQTIFYYYQTEAEGLRDLAIEQTLRNEWYEDITEKAIAKCGYDEEAAMTANVGIIFG